MSEKKKESESEQISRLVNILNEISPLMAAQVRHEDVVIFLATTKSGKSTLVNYLLGNRLLGTRRDPLMPVEMRKINDSPGPKIGTGVASETTVPSRWDNLQKLPGYVLWDTPGFEDNRGSVCDITNAYYTYELFKNVRSLKIALVAKFDDIATDPINSFATLLKFLEDILQSKMRMCFPSIVMIFSKVPKQLYDHKVDISGIVQLLNLRVLHSSIDVSPLGKEFIEYLTQHQRQIGCFMAADEGETDDRLDQGIIEAIRYAQSVDTQILKENVYPSLSDKSKTFLYKARESLLPINAFKNLMFTMQQVFKRIVPQVTECGKDVSNSEDLRKMRFQLSSVAIEIKRILNFKTDFHLKILSLGSIDPEIETEVQESQLIKKLQLSEFVEKLLNLKEQQQLNIAIDQFLQYTLLNIETSLLHLEKILDEITQAEYEHKMEITKEKHEKEIEDLNEHLKKVQKHNKDIAETLGFFTKIGLSADQVVKSFLSFCGIKF